MRGDYRAWGGVVRAEHAVLRPAGGNEARAALAATGPGAVLPFGCGRSYGDVPLNPGRTLIDMRSLDRFVAFDRTRGLLTCEAGVRLADILAVACRPEADGSAWFLPVTPGTRFVTVGGAIANDVHGKNHHAFGTFGRHLRRLVLARSDGSLLVCSPEENPDLFSATVGGLGLTGVIQEATLQLRRVPGLVLETEDIRFGGLDEFFALSAESNVAWEYTAAWIDSLAGGPGFGRGIFSRARHIAGPVVAPAPRSPRLGVPIALPFGLVTTASVRAFNALYWRRTGAAGRQRGVGPYAPALYPLDAIGDWNRLYGARGFYQFQCVVPPATAREVTAALLRDITASGQGSMLTVLKAFGPLPSLGLLSFPMEGTTLALDFPNRGEATLSLLRRLEMQVVEAGGRLYPAKDGVMTPESFRRGYPAAERVLVFRDPALSSAFARRVGLLTD